MVTIGNDTLPGLITTVESAANTGRQLFSPGVPVLVGQANQSNGTSSHNKVYRISRANRATELFGAKDESLLTQAIHGALAEGAAAVYALRPEQMSVSAEDLSGLSSQSGTLQNAPVVEDADTIQFTINSTSKDTTLYYRGDPENGSPGNDEVLLNPQSGKFYADESLGNSGDEVSYNWVDYTNTFDAIDTATVLDGDAYLREIADFIVPIDENETVTSDAHTKSEAMEQEGWFNIVLAAAGEPYVVDQESGSDETDSYTNPFDSSRIQLVTPTRDTNGDTILGNYAGLRSVLGINAFPIFKNMTETDDLITTLTKAHRENLVNAKVNPFAGRGSGVRVVEDLTTVGDSNTDEAAWQRGFSRLVTDYVTEQAQDRAEPFIGSFNDRSTLNSLRGNVSSDLQDLYSTGQIKGYSLLVDEKDSLSAVLDIGLNTADPLRNIEITVTAGEITGSATGGDN